jgi:hypothetical protein
MVVVLVLVAAAARTEIGSRGGEAAIMVFMARCGWTRERSKKNV